MDEAAHGDTVTPRDLLKSFGDSSFLPVMMVPALLVVSPLSGIPLFSSICGLTIAFIALQLLLARRHIWLPAFIMDRRIDGARARAAVTKLRKFTDWLDNKTRSRLRFMVRPPMRAWLYLLCMLCGLAMPFLELVPFSSSVLGAAVLLFSTALLARDGLFALIGSIAVLSAAMLPFFALGAV
ncbi:Exopolysaccharide synthesis, ExoD [Salipiger mucosus DSM 16094]|uniref:Exopolysaccharide synthesis, ExoD n=1 Tax=Salipiger mucosus DSM 16094 TaxID=1123237 RepID=S9QZI9_9RHOB|nr:Exopolysaccharide synthesis, ExoD [Salipiger mucosus DSM 16094]